MLKVLDRPLALHQGPLALCQCILYAFPFYPLFVEVIGQLLRALLLLGELLGCILEIFLGLL